MSLLLTLLALGDPVHPDLADLTARWQGAMEDLGVPAFAMALVEDGAVVHRVTLGRRDPARAAPVTKDTLFYIASATKPYVAFALLQLAEQEKVDLDGLVKRYLPRFHVKDERLSATITVRDLLCHRYGLNSVPIVLLDAYTGEITEDRYYHFLAEVESPGRTDYSNVHFTLAGRVIEAVSGESWRDYLAQHVFGPVGMTRTSGYADWMFAQDDVAVPAVVGVEGPEPTPLRKSDRTMHAAGGLGTSIDDFARWIRLQLGRGTIDGQRLVSADVLTASWDLLAKASGGDEFGPTEGFAHGWQRGNYRGHLELRHGGGYVGAASYACFLPDLGLGLVVLATGGAGAGAMCQLVSSDVHERLLADDEIEDLLPGLVERLRAERRREMARPAPHPPLELSRPLADYAGTFTHEWFGTLTIALEGEALVGRLGELPGAFRTRALDDVVFESTGPVNGAVRFQGAAGAIEAVEFDLLGPERFQRTR
jgi:CubicO group peptidase (beta-lactamase class C family)